MTLLEILIWRPWYASLASSYDVAGNLVRALDFEVGGQCHRDHKVDIHPPAGAANPASTLGDSITFFIHTSYCSLVSPGKRQSEYRDRHPGWAEDKSYIT